MLSKDQYIMIGIGVLLILLLFLMYQYQKVRNQERECQIKFLDQEEEGRLKSLKLEMDKSSLISAMKNLGKILVDLNQEVPVFQHLSFEKEGKPISFISKKIQIQNYADNSTVPDSKKSVLKVEGNIPEVGATISNIRKIMITDIDPKMIGSTLIVKNVLDDQVILSKEITEENLKEWNLPID